MVESFRSDIQTGRRGGHLESLFFASSPEIKNPLTQNLVESIEVTCRSLWLSYKNIFASSLELKGQLT